MEESRSSAVVVLGDLMFRVKVDDALKRAGFVPRFIASFDEALELARSGPDLIIIDLNFGAASPLELVARLKQDPETSQIRLLGYVSHVQTEIIKAAKERGCNQVVARSALIHTLLSARAPAVAEQP